MRPYTTIAAFLLSIVAIVHGIRFALGWPVLVNGFAVPLWASAVALVVAGWIAFGLWRESRR